MINVRPFIRAEEVDSDYTDEDRMNSGEESEGQSEEEIVDQMTNLKVAPNRQVQFVGQPIPGPAPKKGKRPINAKAKSPEQKKQKMDNSPRVYTQEELEAIKKKAFANGVKKTIKNVKQVENNSALPVYKLMFSFMKANEKLVRGYLNANRALLKKLRNDLYQYAFVVDGRSVKTSYDKNANLGKKIWTMYSDIVAYSRAIVIANTGRKNVVTSQSISAICKNISGSEPIVYSFSHIASALTALKTASLNNDGTSEEEGDEFGGIVAGVGDYESDDE